MRLLLVEDDFKLAQALKRYLEREAFAVDHTADGTRALTWAHENGYDCILLDLGLSEAPGGMEICRRLRKAANAVPILIITAEADIASRVGGLDAGADDYLVKPFALEELAARVRALLRRPRDAQPVVLRVGDLILDTATHIAERAGRRIELTAREYAMLELFMRNVGKVLDRAEISRHVWDDNYDPASNIIDVYVARLRAKLDGPELAPLLHTLRGQGYVFREGGAGTPP